MMEKTIAQTLLSIKELHSQYQDEIAKSDIWPLERYHGRINELHKQPNSAWNIKLLQSRFIELQNFEKTISAQLKREFIKIQKISSEEILINKTAFDSIIRKNKLLKLDHWKLLPKIEINRNN